MGQVSKLSPSEVALLLLGKKLPSYDERGIARTGTIIEIVITSTIVPIHVTVQDDVTKVTSDRKFSLKGLHNLMQVAR